MDRYPKDEQLTGIYVKRCKCGARPYMDRVMSGGVHLSGLNVTIVVEPGIVIAINRRQ